MARGVGQGAVGVFLVVKALGMRNGGEPLAFSAKLRWLESGTTDLYARGYLCSKASMIARGRIFLGRRSIPSDACGWTMLNKKSPFVEN